MIQAIKAQIGKSRKEQEAREKLRMTNWEDLEVEQKIERMREIVKNNTYRANNANQDINILKDEFDSHSHCNDKLVIDYKKYKSGIASGECSGIPRQAENYF